jgi:tRNA(Ile)-lysidine synthase
MYTPPNSPQIKRRAPPRAVPTQNAPPEALPPEAVERFRADLLKLKGSNAAERFGLAVSGGPDSVALLLLARAAFPNRIEVATVDHRLRPEAVSEVQFVVDLCVLLNVPCDILTVDVAVRGNVSANAREARYAALDDWRARRRLSWLLTAHHADDQLETFIMRANRGSGVAGLSGIRREQGVIVRPLLGWRRAELAALVAGCGIEPVTDPSNSDERFDRARLRKALAGVDWLDPLAVSDAAATLASADEALRWMADQFATGLLSYAKGDVVFDRRHLDLPSELIRRLVIRAMIRVDPDFAVAGIGGGVLARFVGRLETGRSATLGKVHADVRQGQWHFRRAPAHRLARSNIGAA